MHYRTFVIDNLTLFIFLLHMLINQENWKLHFVNGEFEKIIISAVDGEV